jgi:DNA-binding transcriptional MocR family regulator
VNVQHIVVEVGPKRLVVRVHSLTAKRHREAVASLYDHLPLVHWHDVHQGYIVPLTHRPQLEAWLAQQFDTGAIVWTMVAREAKSA